MNKRKQRQEDIRNAAKYCKDDNVTSFESGAKWADYHPYWKEGYPKIEENKYGLPRLYLCQILTLDMTFGYRYSYRVGFITEEGKWNLEQYHNVKVTRYMDIYCDESESQLIQKDIPNYENSEDENSEDEDESDEESDDEHNKAA